MSDCNHETIKCMKCHRYVGINEQIIPIAPAVARIKELEEEVRALEGRIAILQATNKFIPRRGKPINCAIGGKQHETA